MTTIRSKATATVLQNGKVLVVGGENDSGVLARAELYNPATGSWSNTGSLIRGRKNHTATLLSNGKVLVVGGKDSTGAIIAGGEVYDTVTASWNSVGSSGRAREAHIAVLLNNGKVLVAGGWAGSDLTSADLYDSTSGTWITTGAMAIPREYAAATLLPDGRALVTGGWGQNSTEIYDPAFGLWDMTGSMAVTRYSHTATLLNLGKVLVTGGGASDNNGHTRAELYNPASGQWTEISGMAYGRMNHTATLLPNGQVLVTGGSPGIIASGIASAELYNPTTGGWIGAGTMADGRTKHIAALLFTGDVLVGSGGLNSSELYTPSAPPITAPLATSNAANGITVNSATLNGTVTPNGASTSVTFDFGPTTGYGTSLTASPSTISATASATSVTASKTGLTCNTVYHYRVKAINSAGTTNGTNQSFTTSVCPVSVPTATTGPATAITANSSTLNGQVSSSGTTATVTFDFGTTTSYGTSITAIPGSVYSDSDVAVSANKTGLTCGTTYHYRITAVNSVGTTNGADKAFTTSACSGDLSITNITLNPAKPMAGTAFSAVVTVKNQGTSATATSKLKLWPHLATVPVCTTAAPKVADITALAAGASVNVTVTGLTSNLVGGNTFRTFADGTCVIGETNEANNQRALSYRISGRLPDLIITNIALTPGAPAKNTVFNAAITVKNQGTAASGFSFLDVWTNQATTQTCGALGDTWADVGGLAAGASKIINVTGLNAGATAGAKTLRAFVDSWCEIVESNETNNQLTKAYSVQ